MPSLFRVEHKSIDRWKNRRSPNYMISVQELKLQGKCLCSQYIRARLRRTGLLNRKVTQRLRTVVDLSTNYVIRDVFPALNGMGEELERMHPVIYSKVSRQFSGTDGEPAETVTAPILLNAIAKELFKKEITWGKVISLFAICGGLAVDCVRQGHYDFIQRLVEVTGEIIDEELAGWLGDHGGWYGLRDHIKPSRSHLSTLGWATVGMTIVCVLYILLNLCKTVGQQLYTLIT